jgi:hypothetical protein
MRRRSAWMRSWAAVLSPAVLSIFRVGTQAFTGTGSCHAGMRSAPSNSVALGVHREFCTFQASHDGASVEAYVCRPTAQGPAPPVGTVLVLTDVYGLRDTKNQEWVCVIYAPCILTLFHIPILYDQPRKGL